MTSVPRPQQPHPTNSLSPPTIPSLLRSCVYVFSSARARAAVNLAPFFRGRPSQHNRVSLLRYLFPHPRQRTAARLDKFRYETLPAIRHRAQASIYRYLVARQLRKQQRKVSGVFARLRKRGHSFWPARRAADKDVVATSQTKMTSAGAAWNGSSENDIAREPGARRKKFASYLKAANDLRQTYQQNYMQSWGAKGGSGEHMPGEFPESSGTSATEQMVIFPSYARRHVKQKPRAIPGTIQQAPGQGRDVRDSVGEGDAQFWQDEWDKYEQDNAVVDVDVRGWIFVPHSGPLTRKHRIVVGLARQMVGLQAPTENSPSQSQSTSRASSPHSLHRKLEAHSAKHEQEAIIREAQALAQKGEAKAQVAGAGGYSEKPALYDDDDPDFHHEQHRGLKNKISLAASEHGASHASSQNLQAEIYDDPKITPLQKRASWQDPANMSADDQALAHTNLMDRIRPFLSNPRGYIAISAFFYNNDKSQQKTIHTDAAGHFTIRAALDFVPTHVRILASDQLSATEEVIITEPRGVNVISDIDDTIKHSAIGSGAREIFRNVFIRDLGDLRIQGVTQWYQQMANMGASFHYVSNSPWQLFPLLTKFFSTSELPPGSFHLKQYNGVFQGIFEPVAERKKGTLERLMLDFPNRRFILVGDSGEADLEVYTDVVQENPGRILGVFIRDVTTSSKKGFFDSSSGKTNGGRSQNAWQSNEMPAKNIQTHRSPLHRDENNPGMQAASVASLHDLDLNENRPALPPRTQSQPEINLIDLSSDEEAPLRTESKQEPSNTAPTSKLPPPRPAKPQNLRAETRSVQPALSSGDPPPPPPPRRSKPTNLQHTNSYESTTRPIPRDSSAPGTSGSVSIPPPLPSRPKKPAAIPESDNDRDSINRDNERERPPPTPPRKPMSYPAAAASYASSLYNSATGGTESNDDYNNGSSGGAYTPPISKKEEMWNRRWARAKAIMADNGVVLKSWRVGSDVAQDCERLIKEAERNSERAATRAESSNK